MTLANKSDQSRNAVRTSDSSFSAQNHEMDAAGKPDEAYVPNDDRHHRISVAAYYRGERRGFVPGNEQNDWLEAEKEIDGEQTSGSIRPENSTLPQS